MKHHDFKDISSTGPTAVGEAQEPFIKTKNAECVVSKDIAICLNDLHHLMAISSDEVCDEESPYGVTL